VETSAVQHDQVRFGATVVVQDEDGAEKKYTLVGSDESDPARGALSFQSPIGRALMKKKVGDVVTVRRPVGEVDLEILSISYE
jgi:transcription elongation factor GreB